MSATEKMISSPTKKLITETFTQLRSEQSNNFFNPLSESRDISKENRLADSLQAAQLRTSLAWGLRHFPAYKPEQREKETGERSITQDTKVVAPYKGFILSAENSSQQEAMPSHRSSYRRNREREEDLQRSLQAAQLRTSLAWGLRHFPVYKPHIPSRSYSSTVSNQFTSLYQEAKREKSSQNRFIRENIKALERRGKSSREQQADMLSQEISPQQKIAIEERMREQLSLPYLIPREINGLNLENESFVWGDTEGRAAHNAGYNAEKDIFIVGNNVTNKKGLLWVTFQMKHGSFSQYKKYLQEKRIAIPWLIADVAVTNPKDAWQIRLHGLSSLETEKREYHKRVQSFLVKKVQQHNFSQIINYRNQGGDITLLPQIPIHLLPDQEQIMQNAA